MRVAIVSHTYVVAANRGKLRELTAAGTEVLLVVPRRWRNRDVGQALAAERTVETFKIVVLGAFFVRYGSLLLYDPLLLLWRLWRFRPDVIQVEEEPWGLAALEVAVVGWLLRIPVVFFTWENLDRSLPWSLRRVRAAVFRYAAAAVAGSSEARRRVEEGGFRRPIAIIPQLGIDANTLGPADGSRDGTDFVIGYVGRLVPEKGVLLLLEAAAPVREARLMVVGDGPLGAEMTRRATDMGLQARLTVYHGVRHQDVPDYLRRMSVLVLPSFTTPAWKEQFGHVLIEAMACGVPVIGSDSGAIPEVVGDAGIIVPERDAKALTAAIRRLMDDATLRRDMEARGRRRVLTEFTDHEIAARTTRFWRSVVEQGACGVRVRAGSAQTRSRAHAEGATLVLVNGPTDSLTARRARALFPAAAGIVCKDRGRLGSVTPMLEALRRHTRGTVYCIDIGFPGAPLAAVRRLTSPHVQLVYEIGDPAGLLLKRQGRSSFEVWTAARLDTWLPGVADKVVFRGSYLMDHFAALRGGRPFAHALWLPDGVDADVFRPCRDDAAVATLRRTHHLEGKFVVGLVGSIHGSAADDLVYGWELVQALALLPDTPKIVGVVVGDGPGRPVLERLRASLGLGDRLMLTGHVPHLEIPAWMNVFDVALSTQTDDAVGWGRTTAKLPEYLACGTPVVCTDVGEAHRWLHGTGQTLPYHGFRDDAYPARLAQRLRELLTCDLDPLRRHNRELATRLFDYRTLRATLHDFLGDTSAAGDTGVRVVRRS